MAEEEQEMPDCNRVKVQHKIVPGEVWYGTTPPEVVDFLAILALRVCRKNDPDMFGPEFDRLDLLFDDLPVHE